MIIKKRRFSSLKQLRNYFRENVMKQIWCTEIMHELQSNKTLTLCLLQWDCFIINESSLSISREMETSIIDGLLYLFIFTLPFARVGWDTRSIFKRSITGLNSTVFFFLDRLLNQGWKAQTSLLFTRENSLIHAFPQGINAMWNAKSFVQVLNSHRRVDFLRW